MRFSSEKEMKRVFIDFLNHYPSCSEHFMIFSEFDLGQYGVADVVTVDFESEPTLCGEIITWTNIVVYELKNDRLHNKDIQQLARYCRGIRSFYELDGNTRIAGCMVVCESPILLSFLSCINPESFDIWVAKKDSDGSVSFNSTCDEQYDYEGEPRAFAQIIKKIKEAKRKTVLNMGERAKICAEISADNNSPVSFSNLA